MLAKYTEQQKGEFFRLFDRATRSVPQRERLAFMKMPARTGCGIRVDRAIGHAAHLSCGTES